MDIYDDFEHDAHSGSHAKDLSPPEKAAAVLLAMGKPIAGKLLKFFEQSELQIIIDKAQKLRPIPPHELEDLVTEFEELFSEGTGLMDNAKVMESILEEGLTPDEVDGLLGRQAQFQTVTKTIWDELKEADPEFVNNFLSKEHPQTVAYILSMLPSSFAGKTLMKMSDERRVDIVHRAVNMKEINPRLAEIIERKVKELVDQIEAEKNATGFVKVADIMNELDKPVVESLLGALENVSAEAANKVKPRIFLFDDVLLMSQQSRVTLFNDISGDVITMALRGTSSDMQEAVLSSIGARQRRMIDSELGDGNLGKPEEVAIARRTITQEAIRLAGEDKLRLREDKKAA